MQPGIISEKSVAKALDGHMYNRAVRVHKLVYEALMQILITQMKINLTDSEKLEAFELQISKYVEVAMGNHLKPFMLQMLFARFLTWVSNTKNIYHLDQCRNSGRPIWKWWSSF